MRSSIFIFLIIIFNYYCISSQTPSLDIVGDGRVSGKLAVGNLTDRSAIVGFGAGNAAATGTDNAVFGILTGASLSTGSFNSIFGTGAGSLLTSTSNNSYFGYLAGQLNTGGANSFFGSNAGRGSGSASRNSFFGHMAGMMHVTGDGNSFFGSGAGEKGLTGEQNSFFGFAAGLNNEASENSFFGNGSGSSNVGGAENSFFGVRAGTGNAEGDRNSFFGTLAGFSNKASNNSFVGYESGAANQGANNTFLGYRSGLVNRFGQANVFVGENSGAANTDGNRNTLIGGQAGNQVTIGDFNTFIGYNTDASSPGTNPQNQIVIGYEADGNGDNTATIGNASTTTVYMGENGQASIMSSSDLRMKKNINHSALGLNFIAALRPVQYNWKNHEDLPQGLKGRDDGNSSATFQQVEHGLIAQEVKATLDKLGITWQGWHQNPETGRQALNYSALTVPLIKAVQEQSSLIKKQESELSHLSSIVDLMGKKISQLESTLQSVEE